MVAFALGVLLGFVGSIPAAGPLLFLVIASGLEGQRRRALALATGGALAESLWLALAFWGLSGLIVRHPGLVLTLRFAGAGLLVALGVLLLRKRKPPATGGATSSLRGFATGFLIVGTNPGFLATWSAVAAVLYSSGWLAPDRGRVPWLASGAFVGVVVWFVGVAALAARHRERFDRRHIERGVRILAWVLIAMAAWVFASATTQVL